MCFNVATETKQPREKEGTMKIQDSYIMGAVSELHALKAVISEMYAPEFVDLTIKSITHKPGFKVKYNLDGYAVYVYPIGDGFYRVDFCVGV